MRYKRLRISKELFFDFFRPGDHHRNYRIVADAIPGDAELLNVKMVWPQTIELLLYSESFESVDAGKEYPLLIPVAESLLS